MFSINPKDLFRSGWTSIGISVAGVVVAVFYDICFLRGNGLGWLHKNASIIISAFFIFFGTIHLLWIYTENLREQIKGFHEAEEKNMNSYLSQVKDEIQNVSRQNYFEEFSATEGLELMVRNIKKAKYIKNTIISWPPVRENRQDEALERWRNNLRDNLVNEDIDLTEVISGKHLNNGHNLYNEVKEGIYLKLSGKAALESQAIKDKIKFEYWKVNIADDSAQFNFTLFFFGNNTDPEDAELWWGGGACKRTGELLCYKTNYPPMIRDYHQRFEALKPKDKDCYPKKN